MTTVSAQEIKRRGISAVDKALAEGPVQVIKNNRPRYIVLSESAYEDILQDLASARLAASEFDLKTGRIRKGSARELMSELRKNL